jgi:hypothetical integral membrane protein (TIGR02206 family)
MEASKSGFLSRSWRNLLIIGLVAILGAQLAYTLILSTPDGVRIAWPEPGARQPRSFTASGEAWAKGGPSALTRIDIIAAPLGPQAVGLLVFPAERQVVNDRGEVLFPLPLWRAQVVLPAGGRWSLSAAAFTEDGRVIRSGDREIDASSGKAGVPFASWSLPHLCAIAAILILAICAFFWIRKTGGLSRIAPWLAAVLWINEIVYQAYWFSVGGWSVSSALMLQMCGLSILLIPVCLFMREGKTRIFLADILYFWGLGGAFQALIAPDIGASGFPSFRFFAFFISHGFIIISVAAMAASGMMRIGFRSLVRAMVFTNILLVPMYGIDQALKLIPPYVPGNYFVLGYPPPTGSVVDIFARIFGPSPRYVIGLELMGLAVFIVLWLPWAIARKILGRPDQVKA